MKKFVYAIVLSMFALPTVSFSTEEIAACGSIRKELQCRWREKSSSPNLCNPRWTVQARGAAFIPLQEKLREIYGTGWPTVELESSYLLLNNLGGKCYQLLLWENFGYTFKTGKSIGFGYYTNLNLFPVSIGIEYAIHIIDAFDFYFGIGPSYNFLWIENYDGFSTTHKFRNQFGFTTKTGFRYNFWKYLFLDVFGDYFFTQFNKMPDPIQSIDNHFSAFIVGGGIGGRF
jgi:hypothetical protein